MPVSSTTSRADYNGNGATTLFVVPFYFLLNTDIQVIRTDDGVDPVAVVTLALGTDYTVAGVANPAGGSITTTVAPTSTQRISILRNVPYTQLKHYVPNDPFPAASHEAALDKLTMEVQQLAEAQSRALSLSANTDPDSVSPVLPTPESNKLIGWNQDADALQNVDPATMATIVAFGTAIPDLFSGNGAQTAFALSANPGAIGNLDVAISGVTQRPGIDYTWTGGTTLTFAVAPPAGTNNILARYMQGLPQGYTDSGAAAFTHLTTYGQGTVGLALQDVINIKNAPYNALGNGVTDDSAAFAAALATGKSVEAPDGTYRVSGLQMTAAGQRLFGHGRGTKFVAASTSAPVVTMAGDHQTVENITFDGGAVTNDTEPNFNAVKITGTRCGVYRCTTIGKWTRGVNMVGSLYSVVRDCNIDGYRKRGVSVTGGTFNRVEDSMIFDSSLVAPADANVYLDNAPSVWVINNHITRGKAPGIKAVATPPPGGFTNTLLYLQNNDIDNLESWAIDVDGYWNVHCLDNWCSGGQGVAATGQIRIQNAKLIYVHNNDVNGALLAGSEGILVKNCSDGTVSSNTVQYTGNGIVIESSTRILVTENTSGQMTGLPPSGVPMAISYLGRSLPDTNGCQFINNVAVSPTSTEYSGIDAWTILKPRTLANMAGSADGYVKDRSLYVGNVDVDQNTPQFVNFRTRSVGNHGGITASYNDTYPARIFSDSLGIGIDQIAWRFYGHRGTGPFEALHLGNDFSVRSGADNQSPLGTTAVRFTQLSAVTATINTSDEREKQQIGPIPDAILDAWADVDFVHYKWNDAVEKKGDGARWHFGFIAQRVMEAFEAHGLDPFASGVLCYDEWEATPERVLIEAQPSVPAHTVTLDGGEVIDVPAVEEVSPLIDPARPAGNRYGVRYEEALVLEAALVRRTLRRAGL